MDEDNLAFLDTDRDAVEIAPDPKPVEAPVVDAAPVAAPVDGAPVVEGPVAPVNGEVKAPVVTAKEDEKESKTVPLATFLDILNENKQLKKGAPKTVEPVEEVQFEIPDPVKNPREYAAYQETMFKFNQMNDRMNLSELMARKEHGDEIVDKVREWAVTKMDADESFANLVTNNVDPYSIALKAFKEDQELQEYRAWVAGGKKPEAAPGVVKQPAPELKQLPGSVQKPAVVPQPVVEAAPSSIADDPSSGKGVHHVPSGPGQAFDSIFGPN